MEQALAADVARIQSEHTPQTIDLLLPDGESLEVHLRDHNGTRVASARLTDDVHRFVAGVCGYPDHVELSISVDGNAVAKGTSFEDNNIQDCSTIDITILQREIRTKEEVVALVDEIMVRSPGADRAR